METGSDWTGILQQRLDRQRQRQRYRRLRCFAPGAGMTVTDPASGRALIQFAGNDYLGLSRHPELGRALTGCTTSGAGAARLVTGNQPLHERLEQRLAEYFERGAALCFSSGYAANAGILQALVRRGDLLLADRLCHASLIDGGRLAGGRMRRYRHADAVHCRQLLAAESKANLRVIASDGVFSMDGDQAPVRVLAERAAEQRALLMIDDAHGIGVLGDQGLGLLQQEGLDQDRVPLLLGTFGKSLGLAGAFVAGPALLIDYLANFCRSFIYSTAPPPPLVQAQIKALDIMRWERWRRDRLHENIACFRELAAECDLPLLPSATAIQPLLLGGNERALGAQQALLQQGLLVIAMRPPTVPEGRARLRITLSALHDEAQIRRLVDALAEIIHAP